jgi:dihydrofolate synthase/folylpolyglutamate synthase
VLVTGVARDDEEAWPVLEQVAREREALLVGPPDWGVRPTTEDRNVALAGLVLDVLARRGTGTGKGLLDPDTIARARLPGRAERRSAGGVTVVLDGAHVPLSVEMLLEDLARDPALAGPPEVVLALGSDKDAAGILKALRKRVDRVTCTGVAHGPPNSPEALAREALGVGLDARVAKVPEEAFRMALRDVREGGFVLCTGSLYLAGAIRPHVGPWSPRC